MTLNVLEQLKEMGINNNCLMTLINWSEKWQMLFNFEKCKCLLAGHGNTGVNSYHEMGGTVVCKTVKEKDFRVTINANTKVSEQCRVAASKCNQIPGIIRRNITIKKID